MARGQVLAGNFINAVDIKDELDFLTPIEVIATDNPTKSSDAALANDSQLALAYAASASYDLELGLYYGAGTTADFKYALTFANVPGGLNYDAVVLDVTTSTTVAQIQALAEASGTAHAVGGAGVGSFRFIRLKGNLVTTGTGTLRVQWAQNTSTVENTVRKAGSYMTLRRLA